MKILLLLPFLLFSLNPAQEVKTDDNSPVTVVSSKWFKTQRVTYDQGKASLPSDPMPDPAPANSNLERRTVSESATVHDPSSDPIDKRSAELERAANKTPGPKISANDGYTYQAKIQNSSTKTVQAVFWEFQFTEKAEPANVTRRQFVCRARLKPEKSGSLEVFSRNGPSSIVSVSALQKNANEAFEGVVIINRVEYEDGTAWQRKGWDFDQVKLTTKPAETRKQEPCQGL
ncbi:MAG TPA: hypothetical protein VIU65_04605 [Pyrinomonadaceae bacterium]